MTTHKTKYIIHLHPTGEFADDKRAKAQCTAIARKMGKDFLLRRLSGHVFCAVVPENGNAAFKRKLTQLISRKCVCDLYEVPMHAKIVEAKAKGD